MIGTSKNISGFDPRTIAKCCLWLDGADPRTLFSDAVGTTNSTLNGLVAFWKDKSDANANVSNATSGERPTYTTAGVSYASATNSGKGLYGTPPILSSGGVSAFVVYNPTSMTSGTGRKCMVQLYTRGGYLVGFDNWYAEISIPNGYAYRYVQTTTGSNHLMSVVSYNKNINENLQTITQLGWSIGNLGSTSWTFKDAATNNSGTILSIGARPGNVNSFDGTISEVIIYDSFLTVQQKQVVQRYLTRKWNTQTNPFFPTTIPNCVLWNNAASLTGTGTVGNWPNPAGATTVACGGTKTPNGKNGLMTVRLTTAQTWIPTPEIAIPAVTLFWSGRQTDGFGGANGRVLQGTSNNHLYGYWGGYKRSFYNNANPGLHVSGIGSDADWDTFSYSRIAEGRYNISWNGILIYEGSTSTGSWMDGLVINTGANPAETSNCEIGEIILYNRILSTDERTLIELYLDRKWNLSEKNPLYFPYESLIPTVRVFQPTDFRDCYYWIDAAQDRSTLGSTVSTLPDWSGSNAPSSEPFSGSITLQANGRNGLPVYNLGTTRTLTSPGFVWNASFTQFVVVQGAAGTWIAANLVPANNNYFNYSYAGNWSLYFDTVMAVRDSVIPSDTGRSVFEYAAGGKTSWVIFCIGHRSGDSNLTNYTVNGTVLSSTAGTASSITNVGKLMLNGNATTIFDTSSVAEFIHYNRSLSQGERQQVEGYLSKKWNIPLPNIPGITSPTSVTGCITWLDAADPATTSNLSTGVWVDKGSRLSNTVSNVGGEAFSISSINGVPAIAFPSSAGTAAFILSNYSLPTNPGFSIFMTIHPRGNASSGSRFIVGNGTGPGFGISGNAIAGIQATNGSIPTTISLRTYPATSPSAAPYIVDNPFVVSSTFLSSPAQCQLFYNGVLAVNSTLFSADTYTSFYIGNSNAPSSSTAFIGSIGEVIIYNNVVSEANRKNIENYLINKWKIAYHPYKTLPPDVPSTFIPPTLSRCQLWLDGFDPLGTAAANGRPAANSTVSTWFDKSGNANHADGVGNATYLSNGGVNFDGTAYFLNTTLRMTLANRSVFFVMEEAVHGRAIFAFRQSPTTLTYDYDVASAIPYYTESSRGFSVFTNWYATNRIGYQTSFGNTTLLPKAIYNENMNTAVGSGYLNGSNATNRTATAPNTTCSGYIIGTRWWSGAPINASGSRFNGVIHEIIAYDRGLTNSERQQVEGYLAWKWRLSSSLPTNHPFYKVSPGPALSSTALNQDELYLWLDASDLSTLFQNPAIINPVTASGQAVGIWLDKSGKQRNYSAYSGTYPTYSTRSQVPEIEFNSNGKILVCAFLPPGCRPLDLFVVTQPLTSTGDWRTLFRNTDHHVLIENGSYNLGAYYGGQGFRQYGTLTLNGTRRVVLHTSLSSAGIQSASITPLDEAYDGNSVMSVAGGGNNNENITCLGGTQSGSQPWGNICEVLVFQRNLTNQEKIEVFNYLNSKWFTRVRLSNAIDYLPLATNATNLGTTPQTVTTVGGVTYTTVDGKQCAFFDNSFGMYLRFPYTNPEKFSFCFWLRPLSTPYYTAISITEATIASPALQVDVVSTTLTVYTALPNNWTVTTSGTSSANNWTHYAVTINQITFVQQLFVNGTFVSTATGFGSALQNRDRWILGRSGDAGRAYWGYIRQFALFNTILTPYEINDIYNATA